MSPPCYTAPGSPGADLVPLSETNGRDASLRLEAVSSAFDRQGEPTVYYLFTTVYILVAGVGGGAGGGCGRWDRSVDGVDDHPEVRSACLVTAHAPGALGGPSGTPVTFRFDTATLPLPLPPSVPSPTARFRSSQHNMLRPPTRLVDPRNIFFVLRRGWSTLGIYSPSSDA
eukprot:9472018-Pyramimonas_sp.AAC.1